MLSETAFKASGLACVMLYSPENTGHNSLVDPIMSLFDSLFERINLGDGRGSVPVADAYCPYCAAELDPPPSRKAKCPACRNQIQVETRSDRGRYLVTRDQARAIGAEQVLVRQREQAARKVYNHQIALEVAFYT